MALFSFNRGGGRARLALVHPFSRYFPGIGLILSLLTGCGGATPPRLTPQLVNVFATASSQPWLAEMYACADETSSVLNLSDPNTADILLRIGEPDFLDTPAYQIDTEELLIVVNRQNPIQNLSSQEARLLFAGQGDPSVQVWVYAEDEDIQKAFQHAVMAGRPVTSLARLATSPQHMSDVLNAGANAVGILPRRLKMGDSREVFNLGKMPVLVITNGQPTGAMRELIGCIQK